MSINGDKIYIRELNLKNVKTSAFLFGPRMTGKTYLLEELKADYYLNLLDPELEVSFRANPKKFYEEISVLKPGSMAVVDEIQRVPALLDYVQMAMGKFNHQFFLSGSSARKLKRGAANLLGGRARVLNLHPLTYFELEKDFSIDLALTYGTLPLVSKLLAKKNTDEAEHILQSYYTIYIKEEIQAEAVVRQLENFQRFLPVAAQSNGQMIEFTNIGRECSVASTTVREYYQILEDTLLGFMLWPFDRSERKKARPKFYFFDCGVARSLQGLVGAPISQYDRGILFETWFINEVKRISDYKNLNLKLSLWRHSHHEVDLIIEHRQKMVAAFECKISAADRSEPGLQSFRHLFPQTPIYIVSLKDFMPRKRQDGIEVLPWQHALDYVRNLSGK